MAKEILLSQAAAGLTGGPRYGETNRNADDYCARTFSLPMHPFMEGEEQQMFIDTVLAAV